MYFYLQTDTIKKLFKRLEQKGLKSIANLFFSETFHLQNHTSLNLIS